MLVEASIFSHPCWYRASLLRSTAHFYILMSMLLSLTNMCNCRKVNYSRLFILQPSMLCIYQTNCFDLTVVGLEVLYSYRPAG